MIKHFLLLLLFTQVYYADDIIIKNNFQESLYTNSEQVFISKKNLSIKEIQKQDFYSVKKSNFPKTPNYIWVKFKLTNLSSKNKEIFFRNIRAGIDYIDVFILKDKKVVKQFFLGDLRSQEIRDTLSRKSIFSYNFESDSKYELYIKYKSIGAITNKWEIFTHESFFRTETLESMTWGVIYGIFISLMIYNSVLYFMTKNTAFLFYILSTLFSGFYLLTLNGVFYQLNLGINLYIITISTWYFAYLYIIFLLLFIIKFFEERKNSKLNKLIKSLIVFQMISMILLSIGFYDNSYHYETSKIDNFALLSFFLIFLISIFEYKKDKDYSLYFLVGQAIYIVCFCYYTLEIMGVVTVLQYSWLILPIGLLLEVIFISLALNSKINLIEKEKLSMEKQLLEQSRFTNAGRTISYIIHQIKNPIAQLGSQINLIEATMLLNKDKLEETIKNKLPKIKATFEYINEVSHSVDTLFLNPKGKEQFCIQKQIDILLSLQKDILSSHKIKIIKDVNSFNIYSYKGTFSNIFMVILENAIYELKRKNYERIITINTIYYENSLTLIIKDNAGGVKNIDSIFDDSYSKKEHKGSGLGLALAKTLITKKLDGTISVKNDNKGANFILTIPISEASLEKSKQ